VASTLRIVLQHADQLDPLVKSELDQLISALQRWSQKTIPASLIPQSDLSIAAGQITGILSPSQGGTGVDTSSVTDGQLLIGDTALEHFVVAALTAGLGITITNGAGSITIAASGVNPTLSSDPVSPANGTWWVMKDTGSTPNRLVLKGRDGGVTYEIAAVTLS